LFRNRKGFKLDFKNSNYIKKVGFLISNQSLIQCTKRGCNEILDDTTSRLCKAIRKPENLLLHCAGRKKEKSFLIRLIGGSLDPSAFIFLNIIKRKSLFTVSSKKKKKRNKINEMM